MNNPPNTSRAIWSRCLTVGALFPLGLLIIAIGAWGILALAFAGPQSDSIRYSLVAIFAAVSIVALAGLFSHHWRWRAFFGYLILFVALLAWYFNLKPSNDRDWLTDVAVLPYATIEGDLVTVHNIRNFDYRSEFDYLPAYYDKRFDLRKLEGVDVIAVYWMGPAIAHVFLSFAFAGD
jgi:hypothetical protein